jgi:hypothetical protein
MTTWQEWAVGVLAGIKAPRTPTNIATLKGWSTREKGDWPSIQWCNPSIRPSRGPEPSTPALSRVRTT